MGTVDYLPTARPSTPFWERWRADPATVSRAVQSAFWVVVALSVLVRLYNPSALWLDEAQSVAISQLPLHGGLFEALRQDGSPPLYYLVLHFWIAAFGTSTIAVRALSSVVSLAALVVAYFAGRSLSGGDTTTGRLAVVALGVSPFAVRYSTETRMYALLILLSLALAWALSAASRQPTPGRLVGLAVLSGLLALTHYWAFFLLGTVALVLVIRRHWRLLAGLAGGALLFVPWLPGFVFQTRHTGTPWASTPSVSAVFDVGREWAGGNRPAADLLFLLAVGLAVLAVAGSRIEGGVALRGPLSRTGLALLIGSAGTLLLGVVVSELARAGFPVRYSAVAFGPAVLLVAIGVRRLPPRGGLSAVALFAVLGLVGSLPEPFQDNRTQAAHTAALIKDGYSAGDLVVYCPDQLGPAVSRLLPDGTAQAVFPTFAPANRVDWVDYAARNDAASVAEFAERADARASGAIWLVWSPGYRTFDYKCEQLSYTLSTLRPAMMTLQEPSTHDDEREYLVRFSPR